MWTVYLSGPIGGCSYDECVAWREKVKEELEKTGLYKCLSPMRGKERFRGRASVPVLRSKEAEEDPEAEEYFSVDFYDVTRSDIIFANLSGAKIVSIGSIFEIAWASSAGKFVVVVMEEGNVHDHLFLRRSAHKVFSDLDRAVNYLKNVFNS